MPRVPVVVQNEQTLNPISGARFDAPDTTIVGRTVGAGLQRLGGAIAGAAQTQDEINAIYDEARAKQLDNEYQEFERSQLFGDDGYYSKTNADAINAREPTQQAIAQKIGELVERTQSQRERQMLENVLQRRRSETFTGIDRYAQGETRRFAVQQSDARILNAQENYATYQSSDPERAAAERATMLSEIDARLDLLGLQDAGIRRQEREKMLSGMHAGVIQAEMMRDPRKADAYFQQHKDEIDPETELQIDRQMFPLLADQDGREIADMAEGTVVETAGGRNEAGEEGPRGSATKILPRGWRATDAANITPETNAKSVAEKLFPGARITSWKRPAGAAGKAGDKSWHVKSGAAIDVAPIKGMTFEQYVQRYRDAGYNVIEWIDETDAATAKQTGATGPHWHVVLGKGGASSGGGSSGGGGGTLQARLDYIDTFVAEKFGDKSPMYRQAVEDRAKAYVRQKYSEQEAAKREAEDGMWDDTLNQVDALGDKFTDISQIKGWSRLPPERRLQLRGWAEQNKKAATKGAEPQTDWSFYGNLKRLAEEDPRAFREVPMGEIRARLGNTEFKEAMGWATGKKVDPKKSLTFDDIQKAAQTSLNAAGIATGNSKDARKDAPVVNQFLRSMMGWAQKEYARTGQWPSTEDIRKASDKALIAGLYRDEEGDTQRGFVFQNPKGTIDPDIPDDIRRRIRRALGPNATEGQINQAYVDGKGIDW